MHPEITIAICTRNRADALELTLASLAQQDWSGVWDVLVVDNASTDETAALARRMAAGFPVPLAVEEEPTLGLAHGRNRALKVAQGRAIVFIDDDVNLDEGWLSALGEAFREEDVVGAGGPIRPLMPPETPEWFHNILPGELGGPTSRYDFGEQDRDIVREEGITWPFGANMGFLRERGLEAGGFRTDLGWGKRMIPSEEFEFFRRYAELGGRLVYRAAAAVVHRIEARRTTFEYYLAWQEGYGRSLALLHPPTGKADRLRRVLRRALRYPARRLKGRGAPEQSNRIAHRAKAARLRGELLELIGR